uniref:Uncharacterized protein n=1 Tax=Anopheles minimus TaxID=112268 RepID=A0A182WPN9_9DIPT
MKFRIFYMQFSAICQL